VTGDTHVDATFAATDSNLVFLSAGSYASNLNGATAYDQACNDAATAAGINDAMGGAYVAWISDGSSNAVTRLGAARGFVRMDGRPTADTVADLVADAILSPIRIDETGRDHGTASGVDCSTWSSTSGTETTGISADGPDTWTLKSPSACPRGVQNVISRVATSSARPARSVTPPAHARRSI
jgi:hypothetical protein